VGRSHALVAKSEVDHLLIVITSESDPNALVVAYFVCVTIRVCSGSKEGQVGYLPREVHAVIGSA